MSKRPTEPWSDERIDAAFAALADNQPPAALRSEIAAHLDEATGHRRFPAFAPRWVTSVALVALALALAIPVVSLIGTLRSGAGLPGPSTAASVGAPSPNSTAAPSPASPAPPAGSSSSYQPDAVAFADRDHGLVGFRISASDGTSSGEILRTADGGRTWTRVATTDGPIVALDVAGSANAWAVESCASGEKTCTRLLRSTDGGTTWAPTGATGVAGISFADAGTGWGTFASPAVTIGYELRATTDGGTTWTARPSPCTAPTPPDTTDGSTPGLFAVALTFPTRATAICGGEPGAGNQRKRAVGTWDGGTTWQLRADKLPGNSRELPDAGYVGSLTGATDSRTFVLTGPRMGASISTASGSTWQALGLGDPSVRLVEAAWPLDASHIVALLWDPDRQATLLETMVSDAPITWSEVASWPVAAAP
jgi:hypothetical protein